MGDGLDERYVRLALRLAVKGAGSASPNPMVGAVVVRSGKVVATGYHQRPGSDHAEIVALKRAGEKARGATLYLNLEPCCHQGRTPPCTSALIGSGIKRVVAGMVDPNPLVSGRGIRQLRRAGIEVRVGVLRAECERTNEAFRKHIIRGVPFVLLKLAASLDGKIATSTGDSRWITETASRRYVHRLRARVDAVLVGVGTVLADDPRLTCRLAQGRDPWRVVLDRHLRIPLTARLLRHHEPEKTVVVTGAAARLDKRSAIQDTGAQVWNLPARRGTIPFISVLKRLGRLGLMSVMIEGGATTASRALAEGVVDKVLFFYAPKIVGGDGREMVGALGIKKMGRATKLREMEVKRLGKDFLVSGYL